VQATGCAGHAASTTSAPATSATNAPPPSACCAHAMRHPMWQLACMRDNQWLCFLVTNTWIIYLAAKPCQSCQTCQILAEIRRTTQALISFSCVPQV